jgi:putative addiction module component (TIGR02574 family)
MSAIEQIEKKLLALPVAQRVFLAESLLGSVPPLGDEMTEAEEISEVERREKAIENGSVQPVSEDDFWRNVESDDGQ